MIPKYESEVEFDLGIVVNESHAGQLRTDQPESLQYRETSKISISVRRLCEAHGLYDEASGIPATLLVLRFKVSSKDLSQKRRVKGLLIQVRFEKIPKADPFHDPYLVAFSPAQQGDVYLNKAEEKWTNSTDAGGEAALEAPPPVSAKVTAHKNWTLSKEYTKEFLSKISAESRRTSEAGRQGDDLAWWKVLENDSEGQRLGVADTFAIAMLLKRDGSDKFQAHLSVEASVDFQHSLAATWQSLTGKRYQPIGFDPAKPAYGFPEGKNLKNLREFADDNILDSLGFFHLPEQLKTAKFYK